jgi:cholinesterase
MTMRSPELRAYGLAMGGGDHKYSEDCLAVNIWTKPQSGEAAKAVLLWIHGGSFAGGTPHSVYMDGSRFAEEQDVILVSASYRLNIIGFPDAPGLPDQNVGLTDIRLAVEWVRDNIANFGGDPKRITIFGESAGGGAVDMYAYTWKDDPIINGIIPQSGVAGIGSPSTGSPHAAWYQASSGLGCGGAEAGAKTVDCMRGKTNKEVNDQLAKMGSTALSNAFGPKADGKVVFADNGARGDRGDLAKVVSTASVSERW